MEKTLTDIGFKRVINKKTVLRKGYKRQFVKCSICKQKAFYDYVPYSLSNPVRSTPCSHWFSEYKEF